MIAVVDGRDAVVDCLESFGRQVDPPVLELIVPWDASIPEVGALATHLPAVRFEPLGPIPTRRSIANAAGQHELIDQRRCRGLAMARGTVVALLEDRSRVPAGWARDVVALHRRLPHAVIGGGVDNGVDRWLNWAVFFVDFARYQPPFEARAVDYVTDVHSTYKREALESIRELWRHDFQETTVHWALRDRGETLWLTPDLVVEERRGGLTFTGLLAERYHWGRLFAHTRVEAAGVATRWIYALLAPLLPAVMFLRIARHQLRIRRHLGRFVKAAPGILSILAANAVGELAGYLTGKR